MDIALIDGGTGMELLRQGVPVDTKIWSARALLDEQWHKKVVDVHLSFLTSGARYITTNNYAVIPGYLKKADLWKDFSRLTMYAGQLAVEARNVFSKNDNYDNKVRILGCLPPLVESYRPDLALDYANTISIYEHITSVLSDYADIFIAETMSSSVEAAAACSAAKNQGKKFWVSWTLDRRGLLHNGESIYDSMKKLISKNLIPEAMFINCTTPEIISSTFSDIDTRLDSLLSEHKIKKGAYANAFDEGTTESYNIEDSNWKKVRKTLTPQEYCFYVGEWINMGCTIIGGCCGITPEHILYINSYLNNENLDCSK